MGWGRIRQTELSRGDSTQAKLPEAPAVARRAREPPGEPGLQGAAGAPPLRVPRSTGFLLQARVSQMGN